MTTFKVILPGPFNSAAMATTFENRVKTFGNLVIKDFWRTTNKWAGDKPVFSSRVSAEGGGGSVMPTKIILDVGPQSGATDKGTMKWAYLDNGTAVRRAVMSKDWMSKTTPNSLNTGGGRGHVVFISKKIHLPGIKPRNWSKMIAKIWEKAIGTYAEGIMKELAKVSGHAV